MRCTQQTKINLSSTGNILICRLSCRNTGGLVGGGYIGSIDYCAPMSGNTARCHLYTDGQKCEWGSMYSLGWAGLDCVYVYCSQGSIFRGLNGNCFWARMRPCGHPLNCFNCHQCNVMVIVGRCILILIVVHIFVHGSFYSVNVKVLRSTRAKVRSVAVMRHYCSCSIILIFKYFSFAMLVIALSMNNN